RWFLFFFFSSRRRHTRCLSDWSSDVCSSDLVTISGKKGGKELALIEDIRKKIMNVSTEKSFDDMKPYTNTIAGTSVNYAMLPIRSEERRVGKECRARRGR